MKVAINGFGRIGRMTLRAWLSKENSVIEIVAINDLVSIENAAYLLKYDSVHGGLGVDCHIANDCIVIGKGSGETSIKYSQHRDVNKIGYKDLHVDVVLECTGLYTTLITAQCHIDAGAKRVLISAPSSDANMFVYGVNHRSLKSSDKIISNASCTTNCLAPIAKVLNDSFGIEEALMTTIHAYTATQKIIDGPSSKDFKDGRSASLNIVPATTGAAKAVGKVIPELNGKLTGMAFRVPTPNVSVVDLTLRTVKTTTLDEIVSIFKEASLGDLKGVLTVTDEDLVSTDFNGNTFSSIVDSKASIQLNKNFFKIVSWYDNESGYSHRLIDMLSYMQTTK